MSNGDKDGGESPNTQLILYAIATTALLTGERLSLAAFLLLGAIAGSVVLPKLIGGITTVITTIIIRFSEKPKEETPTRDTAIHEAGHVVVSWFDPFAPHVASATVVRDADKAGSVTFGGVRVPSEDVVRACIRGLLAGRAAEHLLLGIVPPGAASDLSKASELVRSMVREWGMHPDIGLLTFDNDGPALSEAMLEKLEAAERKTIDEEYAATKRIIEQRKEQVEKVAEALLARKTLANEDILQILGPRPKPPPS